MGCWSDEVSCGLHVNLHHPWWTRALVSRPFPFLVALGLQLMEGRVRQLPRDLGKGQCGHVLNLDSRLSSRAGLRAPRVQWPVHRGGRGTDTDAVRPHLAIPLGAWCLLSQAASAMVD